MRNSFSKKVPQRVSGEVVTVLVPVGKVYQQRCTELTYRERSCVISNTSIPIQGAKIYLELSGNATTASVKKAKRLGSDSFMFRG